MRIHNDPSDRSRKNSSRVTSATELRRSLSVRQPDFLLDVVKKIGNSFFPA